MGECTSPAGRPCSCVIIPSHLMITDLALIADDGDCACDPKLARVSVTQLFRPKPISAASHSHTRALLLDRSVTEPDGRSQPPLFPRCPYHTQLSLPAVPRMRARCTCSATQITYGGYLKLPRVLLGAGVAYSFSLSFGLGPVKSIGRSYQRNEEGPDRLCYVIRMGQITNETSGGCVL